MTARSLLGAMINVPVVKLVKMKREDVLAHIFFHFHVCIARQRMDAQLPNSKRYFDETNWAGRN